VAIRLTEDPRWPTPNRSLAAGAPESAMLGVCPLNTAATKSDNANQYAGSTTWIGRYGSAATV
jgi:hypothetical protein